MGAGYQILGRHVASHHLALGTLGLVGLLVVPNPFASKKPKSINFGASSKEEEQFIENYLAKHLESAEKH
ncbi:hypothetical protein HG537_0D02890 [Torulaspora globosa]|uniref:ATP synthase subunit K, mitochondrial n=1 Tax=Torulaspora globosa TaxID=48254 RepID=A0A7H9HRB8_9SACH|nr:hypothetical protein HG537_0D02890 [Torulaspora sp. CBS 2947]